MPTRRYFGLPVLISLGLLCGCATNEAARTRQLHEEASRLNAQANDERVGMRMEQEALRRYPDVVARLDQLRSEHRTITAPRMTHAKAPVYPFSRRLRDVQGAVWVCFVVTAEGVPTRIEVLSADSTLTDPAFAKSAVEAVAQWRFAPGRADGEPIAVIQCVPVVFQLR